MGIIDISYARKDNSFKKKTHIYTFTVECDYFQEGARSTLQIINSSNRILLILLSLIGFITMVFLYLGHFQYQFVLKTIVHEEQKIASKVYTNTFKHIAKQYELIANNILLNKDIIAAFEKEDRTELLRLTKSMYKDLVTDNPYLHIMHFHTKDTKSFLRLHKPEKFGDDLSGIRHMINNVNRLKTKQIGAEVGRYGIYYRVALPVFNAKGKHLGAFEFGINIDYIFNLFNNDYSFKAILLLHKDIFKTIYENNKDLDYKPFSGEYYVVMPDNNLNHVYTSILGRLTTSVLSSKFQLLEHDNESNVVFKVTQLNSVTAEHIGEILFVKNLNYYTDKRDYIQNISIALGLFLILFSVYFLRKLFKSFMTTIHSYQTKIEIKNRTLSKLINLDHLTKINNRQSIETILKKERNRAARYANPLSIIMLDIDDFKKINDTYGHNIGDKVLREFAKVVLSVIRETDHFGRWGGEEFILVATETSLEDAVTLAEKLRESISAFDFIESHRVSCSIGVTQYHDEEDIDTLIHHADLAMYDAKDSGKNRVVAHNL